MSKCIKPPFSISNKILQRIEDISKKLGALEITSLQSTNDNIQLRKENKIKTIQSSLAIEGNTLSIEQITGILNGKKIIGPAKDIQEVKNALKVYKNLKKWNPLIETSLLKAHKILMDGLTSDSGKWRRTGVGIYKGNQVTHIAPPSAQVPTLMSNLFRFLNNDETPWIIKACVFHYELEFIHPFSDGNGRLGRLWQQLLLMKVSPIFEFISIEEIIKKYQKKYYEVLRLCDKKADSTKFIEFSLDKTLITLQLMPHNLSSKLNTKDRLILAKKEFKSRTFNRKNYVQLFKISTSTASRDLQQAVKDQLLNKHGDKATTHYKFK